ncbi:MAG: hypothetical protein HRU38_14620 [Saccharospirillaceae bacterium]|nr:hypothetical protein [Pseudomonadales bacterium]NRB79875.1 hypothetical protein [Saccharospirillaceae bacterium]
MTEIISTDQKLTLTQRKLRKLKKAPVKFFIDSKAVKPFIFTFVKLGSFLAVILMFALLVFYYGFIASDRFESSSVILIKQAGVNEAGASSLSILGLPSQNQDILILQEHILSKDMLNLLDQSINLKAHYSDTNNDVISRLKNNSSQEDFFDYFLKHIEIFPNEGGTMLTIKAQGFTPEFSQLVVSEIIQDAEKFINNIGQSMADAQLQYARTDVENAHTLLNTNQAVLIEFQETHQLFNPDAQGGAVLSIVNNLEQTLTQKSVELKGLQAFLNDNSNEVITLKQELKALNEQLSIEKSKLVNNNGNAFNNLMAQYQEMQMSAQLSADIYRSTLLSLEALKAESYRKLKHLIVVSSANRPEEAQYPKRLYNILTYLVVVLMFFAIFKIIYAAIKEHN